METISSRIILILILSLLGQGISITRGYSQDFPTSSLQKYTSLRNALLLKGWKPVVQRDESGQAMHQYNEVFCGNKLCTAVWSDKKGKHIEIGLIRGNGTMQDLHVAPQW